MDIVTIFDLLFEDRIVWFENTGGPGSGFTKGRSPLTVAGAVGALGAATWSALSPFPFQPRCFASLGHHRGSLCNSGGFPVNVQNTRSSVGKRPSGPGFAASAGNAGDGLEPEIADHAGIGESAVGRVGI